MDNYVPIYTHPPWGTDKASGGSDGRLCGHLSLLFVIKVIVVCESNSYKVIMTALIVMFVIVEISL